MLKNATKFDWINFYHGGRNVLLWSKLYKFLNPNGKIYLKLDMDYRLCDKYDIDKKERYIFKRVIKNVDLVTVESNKIRERIQKYCDKKIEVITNGYQKNYFDIELPTKRDNVFITVGRLGTVQKATDILLEAFALHATEHDWKLKLIGSIESEFKEYLASYFNKNPQLTDRVFFEGEIEDRGHLYNEYCNAKVFLLPARWESFGLVVAEALSCGCRVVISDSVPPVDEFTNKSKYGQIVKTNCVQELSDAMLRETKAEYNYEESLDIKSYADEHFSWEKICDKLYRLMNKVNILDDEKN